MHVGALMEKVRLSVRPLFVLGVIAAGIVAGLMLALLLPLGAGSEGFPALVDCRVRSGQAQCQKHVSGSYPAGSVLYRLQAHVRAGHSRVFRPSQFGLQYKIHPWSWPQGALILCLRPGKPVYSCLHFKNRQLVVIQGAPNMLGMYVDAEPVPDPGP